jgi:2-dehydropantoate 2-reductase
MINSATPIYVIGSGAIGKSLAVFLCLAGRRIILVSVTKDGLEPGERRLRVELPGGLIREAVVPVITLSPTTTLDGVLLVTIKAQGNAFLADRLRNETVNFPVVLLQNGLNVEDPFLKAGFVSVYRSVLFVTAQREGNERVRFRSVRSCPTGAVNGDPAALPALANLLSTPDITFSPEADLRRAVWKKAIVNCAFNSICPLLETDNGIFHRNLDARGMALQVLRECKSVAETQGVFFQEEELLDSLLEISVSSAGQYISTLQDLLAGRSTEIGFLNLEIARLAGAATPPADASATRLLGELIRIKETLILRS